MLRTIANTALRSLPLLLLMTISFYTVFAQSATATLTGTVTDENGAVSNYFTVDGVSANFGSTASTTLYEAAGGGVPAYSSQGSTASLASVDAVQEFSIQTST